LNASIGIAGAVLDCPTGAELLRIARETVLQALLPQLPEAERYTALMVANALAIALREAERGGAAVHEAQTMLAALYGEAISPQDARGQLAGLSARLASDIRRGVFDENRELPRLLLALVRGRLRISNPKYLQAAGLDDA
jgi:hypothetical protein